MKPMSKKINNARGYKFSFFNMIVIINLFNKQGPIIR